MHRPEDTFFEGAAMSKAASNRKASGGKQADGTRRIMLVDDHELIRFGMTQLITQVPGWEVCCEAEDATTALRLVRKQPPDLAVVDLSLQGGSGLTLIKQLSTSFPEVRILVCSMHEENLYAERALRWRSGLRAQATAGPRVAGGDAPRDGRQNVFERPTNRTLAGPLARQTRQ